MSRYPPSDYRGARERSRSPPRFSDRRGSAASIFDNRPPGPPRAGSDAPRGPRSSQFDSRPPLSSTLGPGPGPRPGYSSLRDAPPLGSGPDRARTFRERDYDRRDRSPPPRERSPPRVYPPRDIDTVRPRRNSRDGPLSAGAAYSDAPPFSAQSSRGGFGRGRGRGDFEYRGGRGGRRPVDDRDLFRRERSPPPARWGRDLSREDREPERRDDRRFDRREDDRRPDWTDRERERERDLDRTRREQPQPRPAESRPGIDSPSNPATPYQASPIAPIDPGRLALIESTTGDSSRRASVAQNASGLPPRRDAPETPAYLNGRAETTANRYNQRGSSPPLQAPPVPAFSFAPPASAAASTGSGPSPNAPKSNQEQTAAPASADNANAEDSAQTPNTQATNRPAEASSAPKSIPSAPKAQLAEQPPTAPRAQREFDVSGSGNRLQGVRSLENLGASNAQPPRGSPPTGPSAMSPRSQQSLPNLSQPHSPDVRPMAKSTEFVAPPTGPRASRVSSAQPSPSPRLSQHTSPRLDAGGFGGMSRGHTPPPNAPSGPRHGSFSVSPKVSASTIPTAPRADRIPPGAPRGAPGRSSGSTAAGPQWPANSRNPQTWNPWKARAGTGGAPGFAEPTIPAKRDSTGEEKERPAEQAVARISARSNSQISEASRDMKFEDRRRSSVGEKMDIDGPSNHSARQSFFGKPVQSTEEDNGLSDAVYATSSDEDDENNPEEDIALFNAKYEKRRRELEGQLTDLSDRAYRATTPLESIARLARISFQDLQRINEQRAMEVDQSSASNNRLPPPATNTSESDDGPEITTPKDEGEARIEIHGSDDSAERVRRVRRPSPEIISLPHLTKNPEPFHESQAFQDSLRRHEESHSAVLAALQDEVDADMEVSDDVEAYFANFYRAWREECEDMDRDREEQERIERQQSIEQASSEVDAPTSLGANTASDNRRALKYSSEYDIELVLKQSEETARLEQERQDREMKKVQADMEKEAVLPDQMTDKELVLSTYIDTNRFREPESLTQVFSYEPPADTFTEDEQRVFIGAFKETPKKWGEIASLLPGRDYKDCIHHYYANKWDNRFRDNKTKRFKGRGRGRGGKTALRGRGSALMADLGRGDEITQSVSDSGRPKRAAAPTTFGEKDPEAKAALLGGPSPSKRGAGKNDNGESGPDKPGKRRKGTGEKPGRKPKASQPLAALAAAPTAAPGQTSGNSKEEIAKAQDLEHAGLLASLSGHHGVFPADGQSVYTQDGFVRAISGTDEPQRSKPAGQSSSAKPSASSYWSVPEQTDFAKYIAHFGTDFAAIAAHMGTKTQTMIKNHYMRQIDGGNRRDLEQAANLANQRRAEGQDMGAPPTPTPIVKRKYDNPQPTAQRTLAPSKDAMDIDEPRGQTGKHTSPPHYQPQSRFPATTSATPIQAQRVAPSPIPTTATPSMAPTQHVSSQRGGQHPLGTGLAFMADVRPEPRLSMQAAPGFRLTQESQSGLSSQPGQPRSRQEQDVLLQNLRQEQERAFRVQQEQSQQDRIDQMQRPPQHRYHHGSGHGSPANQPLAHPSDRVFKEERPMSPTRNAFSPGAPHGLAGQSIFGQPGASGLSSIPRQPGYASSPQKREDPRPISVTQPPMASTPTPAPEPAKRSNLFGLLNSDPEPPKREAPPNPPQRTESPGPARYANSPTPLTATTAMSQPRRDGYGQPPMMKPGMHSRMPYAPSSQPPTPAPGVPKNEPSSAGGSGTPGPKVDWATGVYSRPPQQRQASPSIERGFHYPHRGFSNPMSQPPTNPSPPPHTLGHSRTPSLTMQSGKPHSAMQSQSRQPTPQNAQGMPPSAYGQPPSSGPFHPPATTQAQNRSHHTHNSSLSGSYTGMHHRGLSREDQARQQEEQMYVQRQQNREAEEQWKRREASDAERRDRDAQYHAQQRQEQERQQSYARGPPPPQSMHPPYGTPAYSQSRAPLGLREQSRAEVDTHMREQQRADEVRHHEQMRERYAEEDRRRQEEYQRTRTPLGGNGGYGPPPPSGPRR